MRIYNIFLIIIILLTSGCSVDTQSKQEMTIVDVKLTVDAPFSTASITVGRDGNIVYIASSPRTGIEEQIDNKKITQKQFMELAELINKNDFWSFNEKYSDDSLLDATTFVVTVRAYPSSYPDHLAYPGSYSVSCYGDCPREIVEIINKIKELWGQEILEVGV